jgi:hypothetical protein
MGLPFGRYALQALDGILLAEYGAEDMATYLADSVDCSAMGDSVASHCISIVCVGHASDVAAICQGGLAEGARQIEDQIRGLDFKAIHFERGTATAVGATIPSLQTATALADGVCVSPQREMPISCRPSTEPRDTSVSTSPRRWP